MHGDERLVVTAEEAARLHEALCERLLGSRRLVLVLDLDLTLIHATYCARVAGNNQSSWQGLLSFFFFFFF
jgi:RNA polymerase II subunit A-like phosphatase